MFTTEFPQNSPFGRSLETKFRANYLTTLGFVNNCTIVDLLLQEDPVDISRLRKVIDKLHVHQKHRSIVWKLFLGITPPLKNAREFVQHQRSQQYEDLKETAITLKRGIEEKMKTTIDLSSEEQTVALAFFAQLIYINTKVYQKTPDERSFEDILCLLEEVIHPITQNEVDSYFCLHEMLCRSPPVADQIQLILRYLESHEQQLFRHLQDTKVSLNHFVTSWLNRFFAGLLPRNQVVKILDRILIVSPQITPCVAIALIKHLKDDVLVLGSAKLIVELLTHPIVVKLDLLLERTLEVFASIQTQ